MGAYEFPMDIIAKTVTEVSKIYYENDSDSREKQSHSNQQKQACPFGTSYEDIIKFTSDVQIFTKHIDIQFRQITKNVKVVEKR